MSFLQRNGGYIGWKHIRGLQQSMIFSWTMYLMKSGSSYLHGLLLEHGIEEGIVLDLGCGTGAMTERLAAFRI